MSRLVNAEFLKLRSTRTTLALVGSVLALIVLIGLLATLTGDPADENFGAAKDLLGIAGFGQAFALVLGILAVTTEFRHGTITPTLIAAPNKTKLVLAKLIANVAAGLVLGLLAVGLTTVIVLVGFGARDIETGLDGGEVASIVIGLTLATGLWAALGVGLGALVRNQVGAIVGALIFTFVGEPLLGILPAGIGDAIQKYGAVGRLQRAREPRDGEHRRRAGPGPRRAAARRLRARVRRRGHPGAAPARRHVLTARLPARPAGLAMTMGRITCLLAVLACLLAPAAAQAAGAAQTKRSLRPRDGQGAARSRAPTSLDLETGPGAVRQALRRRRGSRPRSRSSTRPPRR